MSSARLALLALVVAGCTPPGPRDTLETPPSRADSDPIITPSASVEPMDSRAAPRSSESPAGSTVATPVATIDRSQEGARLVAELGCTSCHELEDARGNPVEPASGGQDCYRCHRRVISGAFEADPEQLAEWQKTLPSRFDAPSLRGAGRFSRTWLIGYLLQPYDIRPNLDSQMPRIPMSRDQAEAIADFLGARPGAQQEKDSATSGDPVRGAELVARFACRTCHAPGASAGRPAILAPDLAHASKRYSTANLIAWLLDPLTVKSDALMPSSQLARQDAADVAAYLATLQAPEQPAFEPPASLSLARPVRFPEVHAILRARCLHCHNRPSRQGPGGTGFTGGWGYPGKRVGLLTYADVMRGGETRGGKRRSLFARMPDGYSRLVSHLIARHQEYVGTQSDIVGMPLGQPPLSWAQIQVIHTWIEQGRHR